MDRSFEYNKLVQLSNIPQKRRTEYLNCVLYDIFATDKQISQTVAALYKHKYESYDRHGQIMEIHKMIDIVTSKLSFEGMVYKNAQEQDVYRNIQEILRNRSSGYKLKIREIVKRNEARKCRKVSEQEDEKNVYKAEAHGKESSSASSGQIPLTAAAVVQDETTSVRHRQHLTQQISEIGMIMEEIGLHVSLQEESFKRIEDLMGESDKLMNGSVHLLKRGLETAANNKRGMAKFFLFWTVLLLIFWFLRGK